jgi:hypothetical protein
MPNILAKDGNNTAIYLKSTKANSNADPAISQENLLDALGTEANTSAPASDAGPATLNGRLIRIAQRLTTVLDRLPGSLGRTTMGGSISVTVASDQPAIPVSATSLPLPTGAANATLQSTGNASLASIDGKLAVNGTRLLVDPSGVTQPISASTLPLPTGASTAAAQATGNTSLANIDGKLPANLTVSGTRLLVDSSGITQPVSLATIPLATGASTATLQTTANTSLASIDSKLATLGTKTAAASLPVTMASDQLSQPVTMSPISLSNVSGDQTIVTPATGKALRIYSLVLSNPTTLTSFVLKAGNTAISATLQAYDYGQEFPNPLGLATNQAFVINLPTTGTLNGYITWRQE